MTALAERPELHPFIVRGLENQEGKLKEEFQTAVIQGIAAAAGCNASRPNIDDGVDIIITHSTDTLDEAPIKFQLKCTENGSPSNDHVSVKISKKRYDQYRCRGKHMPLILVAQIIHFERDEWIKQEASYTSFGGRNYYLNLTGMEESSVKDGGYVTISVPTSNVFDDDALIYLFAQLRKGDLEQ